jgi:hypothetical protein
MAFPLKIIVCSLKSVKRLPGDDEYIMKSQLPCGEYTGQSQLPCGEYTRELNSPVMNTPGNQLPWCVWNKHQNRFTKKLSGDRNTRE